MIRNGEIIVMGYENNEKCYDDIIKLPHPTSKKHPRMSLYDRAAQFSPFAALTGHNAAMQETARRTDVRVEIDEHTKAILNDKLQMIQANLGLKREVIITYYVPDERKMGGTYVTNTGYVKKFDTHERTMIMWDGTVILIDRIREIGGDLFEAAGL